MNREKTKRLIDTYRERIEIMQHYIDGGEVTWGTESSTCHEPDWFWGRGRFYYKKVSTYRPYTDAEMGEKGWCGMAVVEKEGGTEFLICGYIPVFSTVRMCGDRLYTAEDLFDKFEWPDGTSIGVEL